MPLGRKPVCWTCKTTTSTMWRKGVQGEVLCNSCGLKRSDDGKDCSSSGQSLGPDGHLVAASDGSGQCGSGQGGTGQDHLSASSGQGHLSASQSHHLGPSNGSNSSIICGIVRKSARLKPSHGRASTYTKSASTKGKGRRVILKKNPIKSPSAVSTVVTSEYVFYKGDYFQVGDIVSLVDTSGEVYYAQIRGFMQDQYLERSAVISWLIPTQHCQRDVFDPAGYILGPDEELSRKLEYMNFVCHAPSDYYKLANAPYATVARGPESCYIWTCIGPPNIRRVPTTEEIFGPKEDLADGNTDVTKSSSKKGERLTADVKSEI